MKADLARTETGGLLIAVELGAEEARRFLLAIGQGKVFRVEALGLESNPGLAREGGRDASTALRLDFEVRGEVVAEGEFGFAEFRAATINGLVAATGIDVRVAERVIDELFAKHPPPTSGGQPAWERYSKKVQPDLDQIVGRLMRKRWWRR